MTTLLFIFSLWLNPIHADSLITHSDVIDNQESEVTFEFIYPKELKDKTVFLCKYTFRDATKRKVKKYREALSFGHGSALILNHQELKSTFEALSNVKNVNHIKIVITEDSGCGDDFVMLYIMINPENS